MLTAIYLLISWLSSGIQVQTNVLTATVILDLSFWLGLIYLNRMKEKTTTAGLINLAKGMIQNEKKNK